MDAREGRHKSDECRGIRWKGFQVGRASTRCVERQRRWRTENDLVCWNYEEEFQTFPGDEDSVSEVSKWEGLGNLKEF